MKWLVAGVLLQVGAAMLFIVGGDVHALEPMFLGAAAALGGLWAWDRGAKAVRPPPAPPLAPADLERDRRLTRVEDVLLSMQGDVGQLCEDREFFEKLYSARKAEALKLADGPGSNSPAR